jgi:D-alanine-D-alanine ligase
MRKKTIAVIYGGNSSEFEVSVNSGKQVSAHLDRSRYRVFDVLLTDTGWAVQVDDGRGAVEIDKSDFSFCYRDEKITFDCAFIVIHGTPGEDGLLPSYFEMLHLPFTSCSAFVSTLTFNKYATKCFLRDTGVKMAKEIYLRKGQPVDASLTGQRLGWPLFVKPNASGSSCGVSKVKDAKALPAALAQAFEESDAVIVEEYIQGRELQQGVLKTAAKAVALPITEILSHNEFFDYDAKYRGQSSEITPADIPPALAQRMTARSLQLYEWLGCRGVVRIDYIVRNDEIYFLEINTIPGMSKKSIVPQQLQAAGLSFSEACTELIEDAINGKE